MGHLALTQLLLVLLTFVTVVSSQSSDDVRDSAERDDDLGSSQAEVDLYNVCPVMVNFGEEQANLSEEELKANAADAAMTAYMLSHPNETLWDFFKVENRQKHQMFMNLPRSDKFKHLFKKAVDFASETVIAGAHMAADAAEWFVNTVRHPRIGLHQASEFFKEFWANTKMVGRMMVKDPNATSKNMVGGFLLNLRHHPAEFTAESILLVSAGTAVIHNVMHGVEIMFGGMSNAVSGAIISALVFIHILDDPILLVTPLIKSLVEAASNLDSDNATKAPPTLSMHMIPPSTSCLIPEEFRPRFSSRDLCLSNSVEVRMLMFGTAKRAALMTGPERVNAYGLFHDFVCCFLADEEFEVYAPNITTSDFKAELVATPVKFTDCYKRLANYSAATMWKSSYGRRSSSSGRDSDEAEEELLMEKDKDVE
ncbi:unnamed protein product [Hyaloperonospora brassicae]|uniref:RxLR effector candidate protein n=1 Tax=Hyaloperonospora brassicae TaxID=162125 RepID=A0AAV0UL15_HYABA|nr:unnamed protein product [Hyaloperonospora brassicae]